jgi:phosphatidate cytidylyltransferase
MLKERVAIALLLLPLALWVIGDGGWLYLAAIGLVLALAAAEFALLYRRYGFRPALGLVIGGAVLLTLSRFLFGFEHAPLLLTGLFLLAMTWHLVDFERGAERSGTDFALTLAGILYLGWIGAFLISLRQIPDGEWWLLVALPSVWLADSAAYFVGRAMGRRRLAPRLSPKKTWEGYLAGVVVGGLSGALFGALWRIGASPESGVNLGNGLLVGVVTGALAPLGDLGESMFKREIGVKDSGTLLPGHGGALDRLDSWLWAGVLGFYLASWLGR